MTLSAYSWPSRYVSSEAGHRFDFDNNFNEPTIPSNINLQYVNQPSHLDFLSCIVASDTEFKKKLSSAMACSIRIDGSVDRTQIDKIYIMAKIISKEGELELLLLGVGEQTERKSIGLMNTVKKTIIDNCGHDIYTLVMQIISSICTDGTNLNSGDRNGLWKLFEDEIRALKSRLPLVKVWCSAHRLDLVWGDVCAKHKTIETALSTVTSISSYFHYSSLRLSELKDTASNNNFTLVSIPKLFTIRWSEYTYNSVNSVLRSWQALVAYFKSNEKCSQSAGFLRYLTIKCNLKTLAFLADVLQIFKRFHKKIQSNDLTIVSLMKNLEMLRKSLAGLKQTPLCGGWEETLNTELLFEDGILLLKGVELKEPFQTRSQARENDNDNENNKREIIIDSIIENIADRFAVDDEIAGVINPFIAFKADANLKEVHKVFGSDLDLSALHLQFNELVDLKSELGLGENLLNNIGSLIRNADNLTNYEEVIALLCRIQVCTPHSADFERCISSNNLLKTPLRNRIGLETENKYLHVYYNMPTLENWDPRRAIANFMNDKNRRERTTKRTAMNALYYKGVFDIDEPIEAIDDEPQIKFKKF